MILRLGRRRRVAPPSSTNDAGRSPVGVRGARLFVPALVLAGCLVLAPAAAAALPTFLEYSAGITAGSGPDVIAAGPDGAMWFSEYQGNRIGRAAVDGTIVEYPSSGPALTLGAHPAGIVTGPDGHIWFTEFGTGQIGELDPATGSLLGEFLVPSGAGSEPEAIAVGPDGDLWFTENATGLVGRIDTTQVAPGTSSGIAEYRTKYTDHFSAAAAPVALVSGPDGGLWITLEGGNGGVDRLDTSAAHPRTTDGFAYYKLPGNT